MSDAVESGMLRGRPFGGVICLVKNSLRSITNTVYCSDRFVIIKVGNHILVNVYLPCVGSANRESICDNIFAEIDAWFHRYNNCNFLVAGDFNTNLDINDTVSRSVCTFAERYALSRCDILFATGCRPTYVNLALNHQSCIDYILVSSGCYVTEFSVVDPDINFSDHLPLYAVMKCGISNTNDKIHKQAISTQRQLRWDKADIVSYYSYSGLLLDPLLQKLDNALKSYNNGSITTDYASGFIENVYYEIVGILTSCAKNFVPERRKCFYKFWWDEEMQLLKEASVDANRLWKAANKPRHGPIFDKRQATRLQYRKRLRDRQRLPDEIYTNELHEALLKKKGPTFWKCWRSKFEPTNKCIEVDGCVDANIIADKFAQHFSNCYTCNNAEQEKKLTSEYSKLRKNYSGLPDTSNELFDTELVSKVILGLKRGKAPDIDGLSCEHILFSHPSLQVIISKLFRLILNTKSIPTGFKRSYIVPIPKLKDTRTKAVTYDDFRGIAITPILCKIFEYCLLDKFQSLFASRDNQFGFKKGVGCTHAIYACRKIIDHFVQSGNTINMCALDLSKAFDKVNHHALLIKLMKRNIPVTLLTILENLFLCCMSCVKWESTWSATFQINFGVRQGSVLAPFLFAVYLDDLSKLCTPTDSCYIILYADDILLLSPSVTHLERLLHRCENELTWLDMNINFQKSGCLRVGPRCDVECAGISSSNGRLLPWVTEMRYLGVIFTNSRTLKCSLDAAKRGFYRAANSIFGKVGRIASEEVIIHLIKYKCMPILLYGLEVLNLNKSQLNSLDFVANRFLMKLFNTNNMQVVEQCSEQFNFVLASHQIAKLRDKFINSVRSHTNSLTFVNRPYVGVRSIFQFASRM